MDRAVKRALFINKAKTNIIDSIKRAFIWRTSEITIAGLLLAVGLIANIWVKIGNWHVATIAIYMFMAISLPFGIALLTTFLIDFLTMVFTTGLGTWWWSFALGPILVVIIAKMLFTTLNIGEKLERKWIIPLAFSILITICGIVYFSVKSDMLSTDKMLYHGKFETSEKQTTRLIQQYLSLVSFIAVVALLFVNTWKIYSNKKKLFKINLFLAMLVTAFLFDVIYNPLSIMEWYINAPNAWFKLDEFNTTIYRPIVWGGIAKMFIHILFATPILVSIFISYKYIPSFKDRWV